MGSDEKEHCVGTGCAHATGPLADTLKSAVSATGTLGKLEAQQAKAEDYQKRLSAAKAEVGKMDYPGHTVEPDKRAGTGPRASRA